MTNDKPVPSQHSDLAHLIEPSDAEQSDWPDATRDYIHALEEH